MLLEYEFSSAFDLFFKINNEYKALKSLSTGTKVEKSTVFEVNLGK